MASLGQDSAGSAVPEDFASPAKADVMKHTLTLNIPLPTPLAAQQLCRVLRVDRELKPNEAHVGYRIRSGSTPDVLDICVHCRTIRQLRLTVNALLDNVSLVVATMSAFAPAEQRAIEHNQAATGEVGEPLAEDKEFELSGTGRAG